MKCRANQLLMRTFVVRALSFSAVAALTLNPALTPVVASDYRVMAPVVADGPMNARFLALGIGKSIVIDLPRHSAPTSLAPQSVRPISYSSIPQASKSPPTISPSSATLTAYAPR